jgi:predicted Zn finger-like uncharacterized protein
VLIRCEKCSTVYELDEKVLPPGGAPVQCSRCQFIFTAHPSSAGVNGVLAPPPAGGALAGAPSPAAPDVNAATVSASPAPRPAPAATPAAPPAPFGAVASSPTTSPPSSTTPVPPARPLPAPRVGSAGQGDGPRTSDGRPIRKVAFPDDDSEAGSPRTLPRPQVAVPPRSRSKVSLKWLLALALVAVAAGAVAAWRRTSPQVDPAAAQRRAEGQSLLLRDDRASLRRAAVAFEDAERLDPRLFQARADRDLERALVLGLVQGEAEWIAARSAALEASAQGATETMGPLAPEESARAVAAAEAKRLRTDVETARTRALQLENDATADLALLVAAHRSDPSVLRADAVLAASSRDPARADEAVRRARAAGARDAWVDLAEAASSARAPTPERRLEGVARLEALARAHPELIRARYLVAAALARAGRADDAVAAADAVLAANPSHDDARALKVALTAPAPRGAAASGEAAPAGTATPTERKSVSHPATGAEP